MTQEQKHSIIPNPRSIPKAPHNRYVLICFLPPLAATQRLSFIYIYMTMALYRQVNSDIISTFIYASCSGRHVVGQGNASISQHLQ